MQCASAIASPQTLRDTFQHTDSRVLGAWSMSSNSDAGFDYDRYRRLLAEADSETKRLAFINLLIEEQAKDRLARHSLRATLVRMGIVANPDAGGQNTNILNAKRTA
jgi:hypothetical protein